MNTYNGRKGQLNTPRDQHGFALTVFQPGSYTRNQLESRERGWREIATDLQMPEVLVSPYGEVAVRFDKTKDCWRVLAQQEVSPDHYLGVWLAINPCIPAESSAYLIHKLVARKWCDITDSMIYQDSDGYVRLLGKPQVDHLDGNPRNNCFMNLEWVTAEENRRRRGGNLPSNYTPTYVDKDLLAPEDRVLVE